MVPLTWAERPYQVPVPVVVMQPPSGAPAGLCGTGGHVGAGAVEVVGPAVPIVPVTIAGPLAPIEVAITVIRPEFGIAAREKGLAVPDGDEDATARPARGHRGGGGKVRPLLPNLLPGKYNP